MHGGLFSIPAREAHRCANVHYLSLQGQVQGFSTTQFVFLQTCGQQYDTIPGGQNRHQREHSSLKFRGDFSFSSPNPAALWFSDAFLQPSLSLVSWGSPLSLYNHRYSLRLKFFKITSSKSLYQAQECLYRLMGLWALSRPAYVVAGAGPMPPHPGLVAVSVQQP